MLGIESYIEAILENEIIEVSKLILNIAITLF